MKAIKVMAIVTVIGFFLSGILIGCASVDQHVSLTYEKIVNVKGGSGKVLIAKPVEKFNAGKKTSGVLILGVVKGTDRDIVTSDRVGDWVTFAFFQELRAAGYEVETVSELPKDVSKGIVLTISELSIVQNVRVATAETVSNMKLTVEAWKGGKVIKTFSYSGFDEGKALGTSADPITKSLRITLQSIVQQAIPDLIKVLEGS